MDDKLVVGLNTFFDRREADSGNLFSQWGVGFEAMADIPLKSFDLGLTSRFNFYYPTSHTKMEYGKGGAGGGSGSGYILQDLGIYSMLGAGGVLLIEEPMRGFDYEVGMRIPYVSKYVETWAYAGGYNYFGKYTEHVDGFMARLEIIPTDFLRVNFEYKNDNINRDQFYGEVAVEVPFSIENLVTGKNPFEGIEKRFSGSRDLKERMIEPIRRDVDIVVVEKSIEATGGGSGGTGGLIEDVVFVSETATAGTGDGTFENPYASITEAMGNSRIIAGTCTTIHLINDDAALTAGGGTVNLADLLVWGSGANHPRYPNISNMTAGYPTVDSNLTLSSNAITAMGMEFATGGLGINVTGGTGIDIESNRFVGAGTGISLTGGIGTIIATTNSFGTSAALVGTGILVNYGAGDSVDINSLLFNVTGTAIEYRSGTSLNIGTGGANTFTLGVGTDYGIRLTGGNNAQIQANTFDGTGRGIEISGGSTGTTIDNGNLFGTVTSLTGIGIDVANPGVASGDIDGNIFTVIGTGINYGSGIGLNIGSVGDANTFNLGAGDRGIFLSGGNNAQIQRNTFDGTNATGIEISGGSTGTTINNGNLFGTISGLAGTGIDVDNAGIVSGNIDGNTFTVSGSGIDYVAGTGLNIGTTTANTFTLGSVGDIGIKLSGGDNADIFKNTFTGSPGIGTMGISITGASDNTEIGDGTLANLNTFTLTGIGVNISSGTGTIIDNNTFAISGSGAADGRGVNITGGTVASIDNNIFTITNNLGNAMGINYDIAGSIGTAGTPFYARDNSFIVTSSHAAYGIRLDADNNIFATITGNDMSNTITGNALSYGIYLYSVNGSIGSDIRPVIISGNSITVTANGLNALGIRLRAEDNIFATISGNDMSNTIRGGFSASGIQLSTTSGNIGSEIRPVIVSGNPMTVTGTTRYAIGIILYTGNDIFANITGNDMSNTITGVLSTYGIRLQANNGNIGSETNPVIISGNPMTVMSNNDNTYGIIIDADEDIFANITGNDMTGGITSIASTAYGILLTSTGNIGYDGTTINPVTISNNPMTVTSISNAYGINLNTTNDIFASISNNATMNITASSGTAWGAYLATTANLIGDITTSTLFQSNGLTSGIITGGTNRYMLQLLTGNINGGNYVDWSSNTFTPVGGGGVWSGNYGAGNPVQENFDEAGNDSLTP